MDDDRFDHLTRRLSSRRRTLLAGLASLVALVTGEAAAKP